MKSNKELKKLSRSELLELLLIQTRETERLQKLLDETREKLEQRNLHIANAGDLAHAVLQINGVMASTQAAAQQYLDNIAAMEDETKKKCEQMLAEAEAEARRLRNGGSSGGDDRNLSDETGSC